MVMMGMRVGAGAAAALYVASRIKRRRRTKLEVGRLRTALYDTLVAIRPASIRQVFYQMVNRDVVEKTEAECSNAMSRVLVQMRRAGLVPYDWIVDHTRWMRKPSTYSSFDEMLRTTRQTYLRALWDDQLVYVEIWVEKNALAGVMYDVTAEYDVPLMPAVGFSSLTFLYETAVDIRAQGKPGYIYYFGDHDHDPSGLAIEHAVERGLRELAPDVEIHFERVAITPEQIDHFKLPTRPTKKSSHARHLKFKDRSVEMDALPLDVLRDLVRACIEQHINVHALQLTRTIETEEKALLDRLLKLGRARRQR